MDFGDQIRFDTGRPNRLELDACTPSGHEADGVKVAHAVILEGRLLDRVCGAALASCGYSIQPGLRALGLRLGKIGRGTRVEFIGADPHFDRVNLHTLDSEWIRFSLASACTSHSFFFRDAARLEFLRALAQSARWEVDGIDASPDLDDLHREVLELILDEYPARDFPRVAEIGGGDGTFSQALADRGYDPTVIDPRTDELPDIEVSQRRFKVSDAENFDLLVGIGPCGASQMLLRASKKTATVFTPCTCHVWQGKLRPGAAAEAFLSGLQIPFTKKGWIFSTRPAA